jgi:AcrR family transcriptional regulator
MRPLCILSTEAVRRTVPPPTPTREFPRIGLERANIGAISLAAGYAKGAIYNYFPSKEELFLAVVDEACAQATAWASASPEASARERVRATLAAFCAWESANEVSPGTDAARSFQSAGHLRALVQCARTLAHARRRHEREVTQRRAFEPHGPVRCDRERGVPGTPASSDSETAASCSSRTKPPTVSIARLGSIVSRFGEVSSEASVSMRATDGSASCDPVVC